MPANLRPRVQEFDPFRRQHQGGGPANMDTYAQPALDTDALHRRLSLLDSVRNFSGSVNRFLDRSYAYDQELVAADAQAAIADLTPDQIRAASEKDWDTISRERGIDNPWWKIRLDEAAGRRIGTEMAERLTARGLEASNPDDPNAHLRVVEEERSHALAGMNEFQRNAFEAEADNITRRFHLTMADQRESRTQAKIQQAFRDDVRGEVRKSLDPALGGAVDLTKLKATIESERLRSGNDGRAELFAALDDSIRVAAAGADSEAELSSLRLAATTLLDEVGAQSFGGDKPLDEVEAAQLDRLDVLADRAIIEREDFLRTKGEKEKQDAAKAMSDKTMELAAQSFDGRLDRGEATQQMLAAAQELAVEYGVSADYLTGIGRLSLSDQAGALDSTRFAKNDDPATVNALRDLVTAPDFDSNAFGTVLSGAMGSLTSERYGYFLEAGANGVVRDTETAAAAAVEPMMRGIGERLREGAQVMLDEISDPAVRDQAEALLLAMTNDIMADEKSVAAGFISADGLENKAAASDKWRKDFLERSPKTIQDALADVRAKLPQGAFNQELAFRSRVQAAPIYKVRRDEWVRNYAKQILASELDTVEAIGDGVFLTVEDAAQRISSGRALPFNARAAEIAEQAETALLNHLGERAALGTIPVGDSVLSAETILRGGPIEVPKPPAPAAAAAPSAADVARDSFVKKAKPVEVEAALAPDKVKQIEDQIAQMELDGEHPAVIDGERKRLTAAEMQVERTKQIAYQSGISDINRTMNALTAPAPGGKRQRVVKGIGGPNFLIEVRDGRFYPVGRGSPVKAAQMESDFLHAKLLTGLTLEEVQEGKAHLFGIGERYAKNLAPEKVNLDRRTIDPTVVPFFKSVVELDAADLTEWLKLFPGYDAESFKAAQRQVIADRIPAPQPPKEQ